MKCDKFVYLDNKTLYFANTLREWRNFRGLTQQQLADLVGCSRNTISSIETGQFNPTAFTAGLICSVLNVPFEKVFHIVICED